MKLLQTVIAEDVRNISCSSALRTPLTTGVKDRQTDIPERRSRFRTAVDYTLHTNMQYTYYCLYNLDLRILTYTPVQVTLSYTDMLIILFYFILYYIILYYNIS